MHLCVHAYSCVHVYMHVYTTISQTVNKRVYIEGIELVIYLCVQMERFSAMLSGAPAVYFTN